MRFYIWDVAPKKKSGKTFGRIALKHYDIPKSHLEHTKLRLPDRRDRLPTIYEYASSFPFKPKRGLVVELTPHGWRKDNTDGCDWFVPMSEAMPSDAADCNAAQDSFAPEEVAKLQN